MKASINGYGPTNNKSPILNLKCQLTRQLCPPVIVPSVVIGHQKLCDVSFKSTKRAVRLRDHRKQSHGRH